MRLLRPAPSRFDLYQDMSEEEFAHWLLPRQRGIVQAYVVTV